MISSGYSHGTVVANSSDCGDEEKCATSVPFFIKCITSGSEQLFDPTNLAAEFQVDGAVDWLKYGGLRMMSRCSKANPISIQEIIDVDEQVRIATCLVHTGNCTWESKGLGRLFPMKGLNQI